MVHLIRFLFSLYAYVLVAAAIIGMIPDVRDTQVGRVVGRATDPYLFVFRRYIRPLPIGQISLDVSWMVGVAVFFVIESGVSSILLRLLLRGPT